MTKNSEKTAKKRGGNPKNVEPFKWPSGKSGNPNGRPKKLFTTMNEYGYKNSEISDCMRNMLGYTIAMLKDVFNNQQATALERGVARCIYSFILTGKLGDLETLLHRAFGAPKQSIDMDVTSKGKKIEQTVVKFMNPNGDNSASH